LALSVITLVASSARVYAEAPVALITEISGVTDPRFGAFSEILPDTTIELGATGKMSFVQYRDCQELTATGGTITLLAQGFKMSNSVVTGNKQECPKLVRLTSSTSITGGLVLRGTPQILELPTHPSVAIAGAKAAQYTSVAFEPASGPAIEEKLVDGRASLPAADKGLVTGGAYQLVLKGQGVPDFKLPVQVSDAATGPLAVLRID
jgi:hypothetical protein